MARKRRLRFRRNGRNIDRPYRKGSNSLFKESRDNRLEDRYKGNHGEYEYQLEIYEIGIDEIFERKEVKEQIFYTAKSVSSD